MRRRFVLLAGVAVLATACASDVDPPAESSADPPVQDAEVEPAPDREPIRAASEGCEDGEFHWDQADCEPATLIDLDAIVSGGPHPTGSRRSMTRSTSRSRRRQDGWNRTAR